MIHPLDPRRFNFVKTVGGEYAMIDVRDEFEDVILPPELGEILQMMLSKLSDYHEGSIDELQPLKDMLSLVGQYGTVDNEVLITCIKFAMEYK